MACNSTVVHRAPAGLPQAFCLNMLPLACHMAKIRLCKHVMVPTLYLQNAWHFFFCFISLT